MNRWHLLLLNLAIRHAERSDRRTLLGDTLIDAIGQWGTSQRKPS